MLIYLQNLLSLFFFRSVILSLIALVKLTVLWLMKFNLFTVNNLALIGWAWYHKIKCDAILMNFFLFWHSVVRAWNGNNSIENRHEWKKKYRELWRNAEMTHWRQANITISIWTFFYSSTVVLSLVQNGVVLLIQREEFFIRSTWKHTNRFALNRNKNDGKIARNAHSQLTRVEINKS